jgi:spermidine synthase
MKTVHRAKGLGHDLIVTRQGSKVVLWSSSGVRHTVVDLDAPYLPGLEYARNTLLAFAFAPRAESFLMLGLGGGSIFHMLRAACPGGLFDAVEIDPAVPELARRYFLLGCSPNLQVHVDDAAAYLRNCVRRYDVIILDAYIGDVLAVQCTTPEFFGDARRALSTDGVLVINWLHSTPGLYRRVLCNARDAIGPVWLLHGYRSRNTLLFSPVQQANREQLTERAARLGSELSYAGNIGRLARHLKLGNGDA